MCACYWNQVNVSYKLNGHQTRFRQCNYGSLPSFLLELYAVDCDDVYLLMLWVQSSWRIFCIPVLLKWLAFVVPYLICGWCSFNFLYCYPNTRVLICIHSCVFVFKLVPLIKGWFQLLSIISEYQISHNSTLFVPLNIKWESETWDITHISLNIG